MNGFDGCSDRYREEVERAIGFAGKGHDFFLRAKAERFLSELATHRRQSEAADVLDIGCGVGEMHPRLRASGHRLYGVDPSLASLRKAFRRNPGDRYLVAAGDALPFADASFDAVLVVCVLHHVAPEARPPFAREMVRVLRPGGLAAVFEHNPFHPLTRLAVARCSFDEGAILLTARSTRALLEGAGFDLRTSGHLLFTPFEGPLFRRLDGWLAPLPLGAQHYAIACKPTRNAIRPP